MPIIDAIRKLLRVPVIEKALAGPPKGPDSLIGKIIPGNYLYPKNSIRNKVREGINMELDLHDYVEHYIYYNFTDVGLYKLFSFAQPGMVVFDIGTNIGYVALQLAKKVGDKGRVYGFEPDPDNFKKAVYNTRVLNPWASNITIENKGFGESKGQYKLYAIDEGNNGMHQIRDDVPGKPYTVINIEVLDDYMIEKGIAPPGLIKIDTEGYELKILKGGVKTIAKYRPILFIEIDDNNLKAQNSSASELVSYIKGMNYTIKRDTNNEDLLPSDDYTNCNFDAICFPL